MKKIVSLIIALMMLCAACAAVAETAEVADIAAIQAAGKIVVGITDFAPMDYQDADGNWIGFDADLANLFAASLGVTCEFQEIEWETKELELDAGTIDCVWNGMTLTPQMLAAASCSNAYMLNAQVIVIPAAKADQYPDVASMSALSFAVEAGSAGEGAVAELGYTAVPVQAQADALMEVMSGTSDAAVVDLLMAAAMTGEGTSYADLTYVFPLNAEEYGVAFRKDSDMVAVFNDFLAAAYADGTMDQLADAYGLTGSVIPQ